MATSLEITNSILTSINTALQKPDLSIDDRASIINQFEQITDMIRDGYQFSDSDLLSLPDVIKQQVLDLVLASRNIKNFHIGLGKKHDDLYIYYNSMNNVVHFKTNINFSGSTGGMFYIKLSGSTFSPISLSTFDSSIFFFFDATGIIRTKVDTNGEGFLGVYLSSDNFLCLTFSTSYLQLHSFYQLSFVNYNKTINHLINVTQIQDSPDDLAIF